VAWSLAAAAAAGYAVFTVHLPGQVCVTARPGTAPVAKTRAASAPARKTPVAQTAGQGETAPGVPHPDLAGLKWADYRGYELPVSSQAGPRDTAGGLASGYADSPLGALLAAVDIGARTSWQFGPGVYKPTVSEQVTGQFAAQMLTADNESYQQGASQPQGVQGYARQVAYAYEGYTPADATVDVVTGAVGTGGAAVYVVTQVQVQWRDGDWRVVAPPGGDWGDSAAQVTSPAGFTPFPGQGAGS
jgi:hypothetical protein